MHDYLGMQFDFRAPVSVKVSMLPHIDKAIDSFPEELMGTSATPAADHLFQVRTPTEAKPLPEEQSVAFHHITALLLFICCRVRRDIQTAVAFLTTRVKQPDEDDWGKLKRVLKYLKGTKHLKLTITADNINVIRWYVDASHAVHGDCRGHTGAMMTLGRRAITTISRKQCLNTKSSTESELVSIDEALPSVLHSRYFIESQGYTVEDCIIYQDNLSAMALEKNGQASSSKRTKHIRVRYFFIKDKIDQGEFCPTLPNSRNVGRCPHQADARDRILHPTGSADELSHSV